MHISSCLHPKKIINPYTHELMFVPCNHCAACRNARANHWVQRLEIERANNRYCAFVTLTYDASSLPRANIIGDIIYDRFSRRSPDVKSLSVDCKELDLSDKDWKYLHSQSTIGYLNKYDVQCFIKRLRINLSRKLYKYGKKESLLRYYAVGEYGTENFRPHYHILLFFNSEKVSSCLQEMLLKSWKFGIVDWSYVKNTAASYCAQYLNCLAHLPKIYEHRDLRPFHLFSKCPPIGTIPLISEEIRQLFSDETGLFAVRNPSSGESSLIPLWKTYQDRLYPKCPRFESISDFDRVTLYRLAEYVPTEIESASDFVYFAKSRGFKRESTNSLLYNLSDKFSNDGFLIRCWYCSNKVLYLSSLFNLSVVTYVDKIVAFHKHIMPQLKLKNFYNFQYDYLDSGHPLKDLLMCYSTFVNFVSEGHLSDYHFEVLDSFGIDALTFTALSPDERKSFLSNLLSSSYDFRSFKVNQLSIERVNTKTKFKNDYLLSHNMISNRQIYESL